MEEEKKKEELQLSIVKTEDGLNIEFKLFWKKGTWKDLFETLGAGALGLSKTIAKSIPKEIPIELMKEGEKGEDSEPEQPV